jgi:PEP-CTERM/exosortase A-associated glycosyltransferase
MTGWRILHVLDHGLPARDGYVTRTMGLAAAQQGFGWDPVLFTGPRQGPVAATMERAEGWVLHRTPPPDAAPWLPGLAEWAEIAHTTRRLMRVARDVAPDILHAHSPALNALPALRVGRALGIPVVYEIRAFWEDAAADQGRGAEGSLRWRAIRALDTWLFRRVQAVTTICEGLRRDIVARGIPGPRVTVIPNGVDTTRFGLLPPSGAEARRALGLPEGPLVGFVGSLYRYEGIDLLVDAAALLRRRRPEIRFVVVGGGMEEEALRVRAARAGLGAGFQFVGRVPHREVERYYAALDVLAYPRRAMRLTELVTPLKPLEAMAQGRIVLASDVGGHRELIADGRTGRLFAPEDPAALASAIERTIDERGAWPALRAAARRFVEGQRSWSAVAAGYAPVYTAARAATVGAT